MSRLRLVLTLSLVLAACGSPGDKLDKKPGAMPDAGPPASADAGR